MRGLINFIRRDLGRLRGNVIALVVIVGITVVPTFYAWFNIAGSWDPYGNTKNLKVAVANTDKGYKSDLIPVDINAGERVVSDLRESTTMGYVFTDKAEAIDGLKAGRYYAAIIIPEDFTENMVTVLSDEPKKPQVLFYQNEKANAIAQIVTEKASAAVEADIDSSFADTLTEVGAGALKQIGNAADDGRLTQIAGKVDGSVADAEAALADAASNMRSYAKLTAATEKLLGGATGAADSSLAGSLDAARTLRTTADGVNDLGDAVDGTVDSLNAALKKGSSGMDAVSDAIDDAYGVAGGQTDKLASALQTANDQYVKTVLAQLRSLSDALAGTDTVYEQYEESYHKGNVQIDSVYETRLTIQGLNARVQQSIKELEELSGQLDSTVAALKQGKADAEASRKKLQGMVDKAKADLKQVNATYESDVRGSLQGLAGEIRSAAADAESLSAGIEGTLSSVRATSKRAADGLGDAGTSLNTAADELDASAGKLADLHARLKAALDSGDVQQIRDVLSADPAALASFISAPVDVHRDPVFPIENNGSAMTPFYTTLAIWIGGVVLAALVKTNPSEAALEETGAGHTAAYVGRLALFCGIGLLQSTLICTGDVLYLGTQAAHPALFFLAGWVASITFVNIIFALTASFGDVGKAVAVVLMVLQVAGSGGTFPQQMLPPVFQAIYPFLPFVQSENAMRAAMFGLYGNDFWVSLAKLAAFIVPALVLGLVLRRPVIRANEWVERKLESTKVM